MNFALAGDREISVNILNFLIKNNYEPKALILSSPNRATHANKLKAIANLDKEMVFVGPEFKTEKSIQLLKKLELDYIFGIHFPYIIPKEVLKIPKVGFLNLHPAYLPFNKGWHTPSWAILEGTPYGATLHFMSENLDEGDIIHQRIIKVNKTDTANTLYKKVLKLEEKVFQEAIEEIVSLNPKRIKQESQGTAHNKNDLENVQSIDLEKKVIVGEFLDKLRALSTNKECELPFFYDGNKKIGVKIEFTSLEG